MELQSAFEWIEIQTKQFFQDLSSAFNSSLFTFSGEKFSLGSVTELIIQVIIVLLLSNAVKRLLKERILPRFKLEVGTRESLSVIISYIMTVIGFLVVLDGWDQSQFSSGVCRRDRNWSRHRVAKFI